MKKIIAFLKNPLLWIFVSALLLRLYRLGEFPYGFHVDEVKVAWNSLSIFKTGLDDHNNFLSLYYNSFGDYRPTGIFYLTIPSIAIFGRSEFATRFPEALLGALSVIPIYYLTNSLVSFKNKKKQILAGILAAILLAISPWHIDLSRATNEVVASTFFALLAIYFLIEYLKTKKLLFSYLSIFTILPSYLLYHPIRFLGPVIFITAILFFHKEIDINISKKWLSINILFVIFLTIFFSSTKEGVARFSQVSIFKSIDMTYQLNRIRTEDINKNPALKIFDNKIVIYAKEFINEYSNYFAGDFLIGNSGRPYRFATPGVGLLTYTEFILFIIGLVEIIRGNKTFLPLVLLILAPIPAAITAEDTPNLSRAFLMLPFLIIIESFGFLKIIELSKKFNKRIILIFIFLMLINTVYFLHMYFNHAIDHRPYLKDYMGDSPTFRDIGAKDLVMKLDFFSKQYDKIILTNFPDSPYPWYAFFTNKNPNDFNKTFNITTNERDYANIIFSENKCPGDTALFKYPKSNILIVDSWECPFESQILNGFPLKKVGNITRPDGTEVYIFLERDWSKPLVINGLTIN